MRIKILNEIEEMLKQMREQDYMSYDLEKDLQSLEMMLQLAKENEEE